MSKEESLRARAGQGVAFTVNDPGLGRQINAVLDSTPSQIIGIALRTGTKLHAALQHLVTHHLFNQAQYDLLAVALQQHASLHIPKESIVQTIVERASVTQSLATRRILRWDTFGEEVIDAQG